MAPPSEQQPYSELSDRSKHILATLILRYIEHGEPVSSLWLAERGGFGWSSATVRHDLAKLERLGYVHQPHTSAGRIPTDLGYRVYVNSLLDAPRAAGVGQDVVARLGQAESVSDVLSNVSHELSLASHQLAFAVMAPTGGRFRRIDFVPVDSTRVLVVVNTDQGVIEQKVVDLGDSVDAVDLTQGANYLNSEFAGLPLWDVRAAVIERLQREQMMYDELLARALLLAGKTLEGIVPPSRVFVEGASFVLEDLSDTEDRVPFSMLHTLLEMIERKDTLVRLLTAYIDGPGLTVVIGTEHATPAMKDFSLVMSTYFDDRDTRSVGVIGPRRMRYSKAISAVDSMSLAASRVLVGQGARPPAHEERPEG